MNIGPGFGAVGPRRPIIHSLIWEMVSVTQYADRTTEMFSALVLFYPSFGETNKDCTCPKSGYQMTRSYAAHHSKSGRFRIAERPYYEPVGTEVSLFDCPAAARPLLKGPTGCGKTRFVSHGASLGAATVHRRLSRGPNRVGSHRTLPAARGRHHLVRRPNDGCGPVWRDIVPG